MLYRLIGVLRPNGIIEDAQIMGDMDLGGSWEDVCKRYDYPTEPEIPGGGYTYLWNLDGAASTVESSIWYSYSLNVNGADYTLFREPEHTAEDIAAAKRDLRSNFDVTSIRVVKMRYAPGVETVEEQ